jgi:L-ribulose-5-phosphate 4-epimerase
MEQKIDGLREKLARTCRILEMVGLIDFSGHVSGRLPGGNTFFIHPMELSRAEVTPEDMLEVTVAGEQIGGELTFPDETAIHAMVYQVRDDVNSVIHMHSHYSILPSLVGKDLMPVCHHGCIFGAVMPVYPDPEKITTLEQARRMAMVLGTSKAVIMKGHGVVVVESSVEAAFVASLYFEENARLFVEASMLGQLVPLSEDEIRRAAANTFRPSSIQKVWSYFLKKGRRSNIFWD